MSLFADGCFGDGCLTFGDGLLVMVDECWLFDVDCACRGMVCMVAMIRASSKAENVFCFMMVIVFDS